MTPRWMTILSGVLLASTAGAAPDSAEARRANRADRKTERCVGSVLGWTACSESRNGWSYRIWLVHGNCDAGLLRAGETQRMVHPGFCRLVWPRFGLWISSRRLAFRRGRSRLGARRSTSLDISSETLIGAAVLGSARPTSPRCSTPPRQLAKPLMQVRRDV